MEATLTVSEIRRILRNPDGPLSGSVGFSILRSICFHSVEPGNEAAVQELVLRALEQSEHWGPNRTILDGLVRQLGLFPYLDPSKLGPSDLLAYEFHRPPGLGDGVVFHSAQAQVYRLLLDRQSVILSAPTSFGKSLIIDAVIAAEQHAAIAVIVPTLALVDETRRRLMERFRDRYKVITHPTQQAGPRNIFVTTQERASTFGETLNKVTFFVIDEFYKLGLAEEGGQDRVISLNQILYRLLKQGAQFYLLGPNIQGIPQNFPDRFQCTFIRTDYATVVTEQRRVSPKPTAEEALVKLCGELARAGEPTIVYCASPSSVRSVAEALLESDDLPSQPELAVAADWAASEYHPGWLFVAALRRGIGLHHGRLPRSLAHYVVRKFNDGPVKLMVCTSTLIEGVNTKAKNVVIYDNKIAATKLDYFTFNNIRGRSGRMFQHFVGRVHLFHDPPQASLPFVDFPVISQGQETPESLLLQVAPEDLDQAAAERLKPYLDQTDLPVEILRENLGFDPEAQLAISRELVARPQKWYPLLRWTQLPSWDQLKGTCELLWDHFLSARKGRGVATAKQLAFKLSQLGTTRSIKALIADTISRSTNISPDDAVEDSLAFVRNWAGYNVPRALGALQLIQEHVFARTGRVPGDYALYCGRIENQFESAAYCALEEYGVPLQLSRQLAHSLGTGDLDEVLERVRRLDPQRLQLSEFERDLLSDAKRYI